MHKLILTFDIEDSINPNAIEADCIILKMLDKYKLKALLFITGHQAEKLSNYPEILDLINTHEVGFHSSSHSVRPLIPEFSDAYSYVEAHSISLERETSHINSLTGKKEGEGGIYFLQDLFPKKKIETFRAPGMSWTPPHLEALVDIGIKFDFSSNITNSEPIQYKKIIFYPYTFTQKWDGSTHDYQCLLYAIMNHKVAIFDLHPTQIVNKNEWDNIYFKGNPTSLSYAQKRETNEVNSLFKKFENLLKLINFLKNIRLIEVNTNLNSIPKDLIICKSDVQKFYNMSVRWPKILFGYNPKYLAAHFDNFFEDAIQ